MESAKFHFGWACVTVAMGMLLAAASARAQDSPPASGSPTGSPAAAPTARQESAEDELSRRATDPTNSPPSFAFINDVTLDYRSLADGTAIEGTGYQLRFQPVVPFKAWGAPNIFRMTLPYQLSGPSAEGMNDVTLFDIVILPQSWGRLGIGAVGNLVQAEKEADGHASVGPAIGFVAAATRKLNLGLFNQNLFGSDVAISQIQPIAAYQLGNGWSLSLGDLQWPYDWDRDEFVSMPIGVQLGKVLRIAGQPMRFSVNPQYDMKDLPGSSRFKLLLPVQLLLPEKK